MPISPPPLPSATGASRAPCQGCGMVRDGCSESADYKPARVKYRFDFTRCVAAEMNPVTAALPFFPRPNFYLQPQPRVRRPQVKKHSREIGRGCVLQAGFRSWLETGFPGSCPLAGRGVGDAFWPAHGVNAVALHSTPSAPPSGMARGKSSVPVRQAPGCPRPATPSLSASLLPLRS